MDCYTNESTRKGQKYIAQEWEDQGGPAECGFTYAGFAEFENYEEFCKDLDDELWRQNVVFVTPSKTTPYEVSDREHRTCDYCYVRRCPHRDSFLVAWNINLDLQDIMRCPDCGQKLFPERKIQEICYTIHDVRMAGHPARLQIRKNKMWRCPSCNKTISESRIPGIQHVAGSKHTLRLLSSIFALSIDGVPNGFIAEGYDLNRDYVGELCRKFMARSETEYKKRRDQVLAGLPAGEFYDEPVFLGGREYRAVFSREKDRFYTVLPREDIITALQSFTGEVPETVVKKADRETAGLYAFCMLEPYHRQLAAGMFELVQEAQLESRYIRSSWTDLPEHLGQRLKAVVEEDDASLEELLEFLSEKENFRGWYTRGEHEGTKGYYYRTWNKAGELAEKLRRSIGKRVEERILEDHQGGKKARMERLRKFERSIRENITDQPRLSVVEAMERASRSSGYSRTEQIRHLEFYNELSALSARPRPKYDFTARADEDEIDQLVRERIGCGIPTACLEQLLNNGLLKKEPGSIKCFRHRQRGGEGCCTLECPFMSPKG